jgi:hypothetical protein
MEKRAVDENLAGFQRAPEERLNGISQTEQVDLNRLRRQVSFDRVVGKALP